MGKTKATRGKAASARAKRTAKARGGAASLLELQQRVSDLCMERDEARDDLARALEQLKETARALGPAVGLRFDMLPDYVYALQRQTNALREDLEDARRAAMANAAGAAALAGAKERIASLEATIPLGTAELHARIKELEERSRLEAV